MKRLLVLSIMGFLLASGPSYASPANCDDDMTEDQRFQSEICSAHLGCRFVFGIMDSCIKAKSFLSKLGIGGKGSATKLTDGQVGQALESSGVPRSALASCLFDFDLDKCRSLLNGGPKKPDAQEQADEISQRLIDMTIGTKSEQSTQEMARAGLINCEKATSDASTLPYAQAKKTCEAVKNAIGLCLSTKARYDEHRAELQRLIDSGGVTNKIYKNLASKPYPECPTTLPGSGKTPEAALADYQKRAGNKLEDEAKKSLDLARSTYAGVKAKYDKPGGKRTDAEKEKDLEKLRTMKSFLEAHEHKLSSGKEGGSEKLSAEMLKLIGDIESLVADINSSEDSESVALTRRDKTSNTDMFKQAITRAEKEEQETKDRQAREAREREEKVAREAQERARQLAEAESRARQAAAVKSQATQQVSSGTDKWQCNDESKSIYKITVTPTALRIPYLISSGGVEDAIEKQVDGTYLQQDRPGNEAYKTIIRFKSKDTLNMAFTNIKGVVNSTFDCFRMKP